MAYHPNTKAVDWFMWWPGRIYCQHLRQGYWTPNHVSKKLTMLRDKIRYLSASVLIGQKTPFLLLLEKWSLILFDWSCECACRRVLCMSHFILLYGSLDVGVRWGAAIVLIVHGDVTNGQHDVTNQRHDVSDSQYLKRNQYHRLSRVFGYWEYLVSEISQSRGLSVNPISRQLTMYIFWLVLGARHFLSCRVIICNCHWEHPREGCVQSN